MKNVGYLLMARSSRVRQGVFESPLIVALFFYEKLVYSTRNLFFHGGARNWSIPTCRSNWVWMI